MSGDELMKKENNSLGIVYMSNILCDDDIKKIKKYVELSNMPISFYENTTKYWASIDDLVAQVKIFLSNDLVKSLMNDMIFLFICKLCNYIKNIIKSRHIKKIQGDKITEVKTNIHLQVKNICFIIPDNLSETELELYIELALKLSTIVNFQNQRYVYYNNEKKELFVYTENELMEKFYREYNN